MEEKAEKGGSSLICSFFWWYLGFGYEFLEIEIGHIIFDNDQW